MAYQLSLAPQALAYELVKISPEYFGCLHLPRRVDIQLRGDGCLFAIPLVVLGLRYLHRGFSSS
jgi:hypothetical protein